MAERPESAPKPRGLLARMRRRRWLRRHMRHPYLNLTGSVWRCSCGATRSDRSTPPAPTAHVSGVESRGAGK